MERFFGGIISKEICNPKRQVEVDIARGLAVFFMILVHFNSTFLDTAYNSSMFAKVIDFMGCVPAAPVFMFLMGVGFVYTKKQDPQILFKRGLFIFCSGYILNLFRGVLPYVIGAKLGFYELAQTQIPGYDYLVEVDILQFAGLAMIAVSFFKGVKISEVIYPLIAIFAVILSPYMWKVQIDQPILEVLLANIFGGKSYTFHPFFPWIFYPLMGAFFGWLLIRAKNKNAFYAVASLVSVLAIIGGVIYYNYLPGYDFGIVTGNVYNYFQHGAVSSIIFGASIVCWLALWNFVSPIMPKLLKDKLAFWSKATTPIYVIHWLFLSWCSFLIFDTFNIWQSVLGIIILIIATDIAADLYIKIKDRLAECREIDIPYVFENENVKI